MSAPGPREPIDAEFVEVEDERASVASSPWPRRANEVGPATRIADAPAAAPAAGDRARGVSALLAAGAGVLAEGSRAAGEVATAADEIEGGVRRATAAGERLGAAASRVGDALRRMGVIGRSERAPTMAETRGRKGR